MQYRHSIVAHFASNHDARVAQTKLDMDGIASEIVLDRDDDGVIAILLTVDESDLITAQRLLVAEVEANQKENAFEEGGEPFESLSEAEEEAAQHAAGLDFARRLFTLVAILMAILLALQYFGIR